LKLWEAQGEIVDLRFARKMTANEDKFGFVAYSLEIKTDMPQ